MNRTDQRGKRLRLIVERTSHLREEHADGFLHGLHLIGKFLDLPTQQESAKPLPPLLVGFD
ncbi:hypothetical protein [Thermoflexus hugenholtzii]